MKRSKSLIIGVTGGVGAGKSTILNVLEKKYGAVIYLADDIAKELMMPGQASYEALIAEFGSDILDENGKLDSKKMSQVVFFDPDKSRRVNEIVHPIVVDEMKKRAFASCTEAQKQGQDLLVVMEAALLIESGLYRVCDRLWYAYASEETRTKRLIESRGYSREKCESIIKRQLTEAEFAVSCTDIINTSGDFEDTEKIIDEHVEILDAIYPSSTEN